MSLTDAHLRSSEALNTVRGALEGSGLEGEHLIIEITASMLMEKTDEVVKVLGVLQELEVRIHVHDFGSGYSWLSRPDRLPVDAIKVDRSLVERLPVDADTRVIVQAIIDLAHLLAQVTIAEGIESPEQLALLRSFGCDLGHGTLFAEPTDAEATKTLLSSAPGWLSHFGSPRGVTSVSE